MRFSTLVAAAALVCGAHAAELYIPKEVDEKHCSMPATYNSCVANLETMACDRNDIDCNCRQAKGYVHCTYYCPKDPGVQAYFSYQQSVVERYCPYYTSTPTPSPTPTEPSSPSSLSGDSNPSTTPLSILNGASKTDCLSLALILSAGLLFVM
ncbi:hypothetical protein K493DRAFT_335783 [Basidiobolus meristosporus CBS 931.73]|uniref:Extracellular membrane protein CFEM domain-containing protein n=1 Tax=Basidiobolus meristosporus CBS 931.73 TaxID=1314790 RepID=A0A1Y1YMZ8_9FUNG|nr:hypothetical protein K493DRAFT_335783 [Basidiobolus meristosporus CBS 931.73]|eukprot:ORX99381.1 hypothetical protein K493DRAFT_335783 [Basidiobolus meristosporus CBS 931.73]